jgi:pimeloyl-ACP methyl ester carboxylesterase
MVSNSGKSPADVASRREQPVAIGGQFGWHHAPDHPDASGIGIVLCNAFGGEMMCAHAGWRALAIELAATGLPVLRFDYTGTGDSAGDDHDPHRLDAWRAGIGAAIDGFRSASGVERVILVGLRLGALLAAEAAAGRTDVIGLAALAPVVSGRLHARELAALARLGRLRSDDAEPDDDEIGGIGVNGFFFSDETLADLRELDLKRLDHLPAHILILSRDGTQADAGLAGQLREQGAKVEIGAFEGYDAFMDSPTTTVVPQASWRCITTWCRALAEGAAVSPASKVMTRFAPAETAGPGWHEAPLFSGAALFGILTTPSPETGGDLAVIILNAGRNHHIGWGRGSVELARALATEGTPVLRFDAAGIGDSPGHPGGPEEVLYAPEQIEDVVDALDRLGERGYRRFHVVGACAGAYLGLHASLRDPRIVGFTLINLLRFHWRKGDSLAVAMQQQAFRPTGSYLARLRDAGTWRRILKGEVALLGIAGALVRRIGRKLGAFALNLLARSGITSTPEREAEGWFRQLTSRGCDMQLVYSAEDPALVELAQYFGPDGQRLTDQAPVAITVIPDADHNQSQRHARRKTLGLIRQALAHLRERPEPTG